MTSNVMLHSARDMQGNKILSVDSHLLVNVEAIFCNTLTLFLVILGYIHSFECCAKKWQSFPAKVPHSDTSSRHNCHECVKGEVGYLGNGTFDWPAPCHLRHGLEARSRNNAVTHPRQYHHSSQQTQTFVPVHP